MSQAEMAILQRIEDGQKRVEAKLDELLQALAEDNGGEAPEQRTLEGDPAGKERDQTRSLDEG